MADQFGEVERTRLADAPVEHGHGGIFGEPADNGSHPLDSEYR